MQPFHIFKRQARDPVAPTIFGHIQRFIDSGKKLINRFPVMVFGHADAHRHRQRLILADRLADPFRQYQGARYRRMR